jgi:hypothetical protein
MAAIRPPLPAPLPVEITERVGVFDRLLDPAHTEPHQAVQDAWPPLREITAEAHERRVRPLPFQGYKVVDMVTDMADEGIVEPGWVDVAYPLYYWAIGQTPETLAANPGLAKTYVCLARALAAALLLALEAHRAAGGRD